jgi:hypothetical protein
MVRTVGTVAASLLYSVQTSAVPSALLSVSNEELQSRFAYGFVCGRYVNPAASVIDPFCVRCNWNAAVLPSPTANP